MFLDPDTRLTHAIKKKAFINGKSSPNGIKNLFPRQSPLNIRFICQSQPELQKSNEHKCSTVSFTISKGPTHPISSNSSKIALKGLFLKMIARFLSFPLRRFIQWLPK